ncbi:hypothetical protein ACO11K_003423 [Bacillus cytotoxicus]
MDSNIIKFPKNYSIQTDWCLDIYKKCALIEDLVENQFEEMLGIPLVGWKQPFEKIYENLLFAAICELGGHKGHYQTLHQTEWVYEYLYQGMQRSIFLLKIQDIICNDNTTGDDKSSITSFQAASIVKKGIMEFNAYMSNFLTEITGNNNPVPFKRLDKVYEEIERFEEFYQ